MSTFVMALLALCAVTCIVLLIVIVYDTVVYFYRQKLFYEEFYETVTVLNKKYKSSYFDIYDDCEEFLVYVSYEGKNYLLEDEDLYKEAEVGKKVRVIVQKGYNKYGKLKYVELRECD